MLVISGKGAQAAPGSPPFGVDDAYQAPFQSLGFEHCARDFVNLDIEQEVGDQAGFEGDLLLFQASR
jgi:hypothetical protein